MTAARESLSMSAPVRCDNVDKAAVPSVQEDAIPLVGADIVIADEPRVFHPEFAGLGIEFPQRLATGLTVERLCHDSLPDAPSAVRLASLFRLEARRGIQIEKAVSVEICETAAVGPADSGHAVLG